VFAEVLAERVAAFCRLSDGQIALLAKHYEVFLRWNRVLNLSAVRAEVGIVERHYAESLFLAAWLPSGIRSVADVGSGAGFPGVPVAVLHPEACITLIEAHRRKAVFLREATRGIANVRVAAVRAETVGKEFDWVTSRAVKYDDIGETLVRLGRRAALLTGPVNAEELPGFDWEDPITLPWGERRLLWIGRRSAELSDEDCST
jgi:16S rRNA (guanine527-N7)-methyltransferase